MHKYKKNATARAAIFKRRMLQFECNVHHPEPPDKEVNVLVINSSEAMAKEMTLQLTLGIPGCSIMYAPSIQLAKWILSRRTIDLVVSSPLLPDGGIAGLKDTLERMSTPPDVVVVGNVEARMLSQLEDSIYEVAAFRRLGPAQKNNSRASDRGRPTEKLGSNNRDFAFNRTLSSLGADLRNDLNNPLQEIVAMVFVAQSGGKEGNPATNQALHAIDKAAKNMSEVVNKLETRIRNAVRPLGQASL